MSIVEIIAHSLFIAGVTLAVVEGLASYALSFRDRRTILWAAGRKRSIHDPDVGWVNKPNTHIQDMYGPGGYVKINSQGFRSNYDFDQMVPDGKCRIICSGDSFTFGEGVDNDHTWCQLLASHDPRIESLNMGQTGYGIDQAYLWYKRDGLRFSHHVHLLEFITDDFYRMQSAVFAGYAKPVLEVVDDRLTVTNVPVPRRSYYLTWLARHVRNLNQFRTIEFFQRAVQKVRGHAAVGSGSGQEARNKKTREVLRKIFEDLKSLSEERSIRPVLVYLPTLHELLSRDTDSQKWLAFLQSESNALGIPLFDVVSDFRRLPAGEVIGMFRPEGQSGPNHFNDQGNAFVAGIIYEKLRSHPSVAQTLDPDERDRPFSTGVAYPVSATVDHHIPAERSLGLSVGQVCAAVGALSWWRGHRPIAATLLFVAGRLISSTSVRSRS